MNIENVEGDSIPFEWYIPNGRHEKRVNKPENMTELEAGIYALFDIRRETELLREIKDILDELNMIAHVYKQQMGVLSSLRWAMNNLLGTPVRSELTSKPAPIKFKDAVGRRFSFPYHLCKEWSVS